MSYDKGFMKENKLGWAVKRGLVQKAFSDAIQNNLRTFWDMEQNAYAEIHKRFGEVDHFFALIGDAEGGHC